MWSECTTSFPSSGASVFIESVRLFLCCFSCTMRHSWLYSAQVGQISALGIWPVYHCLKSTFREWPPDSLSISFPVLCRPVWERFPKYVCLFSGDCQKAPESCTSIRVPASSFGGLYCVICFDGIPTLRVHLLTSSIMNFSLHFRLSFGLLSPPPLHPCGIRRIMSRQWVPCGDMLIFCSLFGQVELVGLGVGCLIKSRQVRVRTANTRVNPFMKAKNITEVKDESSFL